MKTFLVVAVVLLVVMACSSTTLDTRVFPKSATIEVPAIPVTGRDGFNGCGGTLVPSTNDAFEQAVVEQTNQIRMEAGLGPLKRVDGLNNSARYHAADMSVDNYFNHNTMNVSMGQEVEVCDTWNRIESFYTDWQALAENIAAGQRVPEMAIEGWMNSPDHRHNILSDSYWEIGVGFFEGTGEYRYYWVQNFGRTGGRFPLIINGEKARTESPDVSVYIYGSWQAMRLRVDGGEWSDWMPFQREFAWSLPQTPGTHTITAELRGLTGQATSEDSIILGQQ